MTHRRRMHRRRRRTIGDWQSRERAAIRAARQSEMEALLTRLLAEDEAEILERMRAHFCAREDASK